LGFVGGSSKVEPVLLKARLKFFLTFFKLYYFLIDKKKYWLRYKINSVKEEKPVKKEINYLRNGIIEF